MRRVFIATVLAIGTLAIPGQLVAAPAGGIIAICQGRVATIVGTPGDDLLVGTAGPDVIAGRDGNDRILGLGGNDWICGGRGKDRVLGGGGADRVDLGADSDTAYGGPGGDRIAGGTGSDLVDGGSGPDMLDGGFGIDMVSYLTAPGTVSAVLDSADTGWDHDRLAGFENLEGSNFVDFLAGNDHANNIFGRGGDDLILGPGGPDPDPADFYDGGPGDDTVTYVTAGAALVADLGAGTARIGAQPIDSLVSVEGVGGTNFADVITGSDVANEINGAGGNDSISGLGGNDDLNGAEGDDIIDGGNGDDRLRGEGGADTLNGDGGIDEAYGGDGDDLCTAETEESCELDIA